MLLRTVLFVTTITLVIFGIAPATSSKQDSPRKTGMVRGRVYDQENSQGVANIVLRINDAETISDARGHFEFVSLIPGSYFFEVGAKSLPVNKVTAEMMPKSVEIKPETQVDLDIALTWKSNLSGKILVYRVTDDSSAADRLLATRAADPGSFIASYSVPVETYRLNQALIELQNKDQIRRRVSDAEGRFHFRDLPHGKWTLSISDYYLPRDHYLEQQSAEIELVASVGKEVLVSIFPNRQNFQIIDEATTSALADVDLEAGPSSPSESNGAATESSVSQFHTVEPGDWLSKIAERFYGDPMLYSEIFKANREIIDDPNFIFPGQTLQIPQVQPESKYYTVLPGDWLSKIAIKFYSNTDFSEILSANRQVIENPDIIFPGQSLLIPRAKRFSSVQEPRQDTLKLARKPSENQRTIRIASPEPTRSTSDDNDVKLDRQNHLD